MRRIALFLPAALAVAAVVTRLLRKRGDSGPTDLADAVADRAPREDAGAPPSDAPATESVDHTHACTSCGTEYRVSGEGRHRVYWHSEASKSDPVLDGRCVKCGETLPGENPRDDDAADAAAPPTEELKTEDRA